MNKSDWYKLLAIGVVAAFVIEGVAIGMMSSNSQPVDDGLQPGGSGQSMLGTAYTNLTVLRYEPYLIVKGSGPAVDAVKQSLIGRGIATYAVPSGGSLIVNLNRSKYAVLAGAEFEAANATVLAQITYGMPPTIRVDGGNGISATVDGLTFKVQARPLYEEGSRVPASMGVQVDAGKIIGIGNLNILPESVAGAIVEARLSSAPESSYSVEVPWESRLAAKEAAAGAGASYRQRSYVIVPGNATTQQLDAIKLYPYVTGSQTGIVSVKNDFANITKATEEFMLARMPPEFPPSIAEFPDDTGGERAALLVKALQDGGIGAVLARHTTVRAVLPESVEKNGRIYHTGGQELEFELVGELGNATSVVLSIDFDAAGSTVSRITGVRQAG